MAVAAFAPCVAPFMSRLAEQQPRVSYSWPPTPPRWTRTEQPSPAVHSADDDEPIIVSDIDSDDEERPSNEVASTSAPTDERKAGGSTAPLVSITEGGSSSEGEDEEEEDDEKEVDESKARDSEETEDEEAATAEEAVASSSVVQEVRDVQHEDFSASQRELQEDAAAAAEASEAKQPDTQPPSRMDTSGDGAAQQRDKRRIEAVSGTNEQPSSKQHKCEPLPPIIETKQDHDGELMIDDARSKLAAKKTPSQPAAITPPTHSYFATSSPPTACSALGHTNGTAPLPTALVSANPTAALPPASPPPNSEPPRTSHLVGVLVTPQGPPPPVLKLLRSATHNKSASKPPLTINLSPQTTLFYYDPDTSNRSATDTTPLQPIRRTSKRQRTQLAAWQLLQRQEELEEELAAADDAMEKDEQAGQEVAEKWERKIDALQEEVDEIEDELEARADAEKERDRREREAWYTYSRLGATEEEKKRMDEEDEAAEAELGDDSDGDSDDSEESAEETEPGKEEEKEAPAPTSPPSNPFEKADRPAAAHFKEALSDMHSYYHVNEDDFKVKTEDVWAHGGFKSGLFFEGDRKEEARGARQQQQRREEMKQPPEEERKEAMPEAQPVITSTDTVVANRDVAPVTSSSPKLSPLAAPTSSHPHPPSPPPPAAAPQPVAPVKQRKPSPPPAPALVSKPVTPPPDSPASVLTPSPPTTVPATALASSSSTIVTHAKPAVKSAAASSFFPAPPAATSSSSSLSRASLAAHSTSTRRVVTPQLIGPNTQRPANMVANGRPPTAAPASRVKPAASADDMIDLTEDD